MDSNNTVLSAEGHKCLRHSEIQSGGERGYMDYETKEEEVLVEAQLWVEAKDYESYEDYLDSHISDQDIFYLEDRSLARRLLEFSAENKDPSKRKVLSEHVFQHYKQRQAMQRQQDFQRKLRRERGEPEPEMMYQRSAEEEARIVRLVEEKRSEMNPLQKKLWEHKAEMDTKKLTPILFLRASKIKSSIGEVSAYIDVAERLNQVGSWERFLKSGTLKPLKSDLCFFDWVKKCTTYAKESEHFLVNADDKGNGALRFQPKDGGSIITVGESYDPSNEKEGIKKSFQRLDFFYLDESKHPYRQAVLYLPVSE